MNKNLKIILQGVGLLVIIALAFYLASLASDSELVREIVSSYGYVGIFLISILSGFNFVVPIPAVAFLPLFLESSLSFWPTIFLITLGVTSADTMSYILARAGKHIASQSFGENMFKGFNRLNVTYPRAPLVLLFFYASFVPLPNELLLVPMALSSYRLREIIPILLVGNFVHQLLYAKGILSVFNIF